MKLSIFLSIALGFVFIFSVFTFSPVMAANKYNKDYFGETVIHKAVFEDTLIHLSRHNGLGFVEVRAANPDLDAWIPGAGAKVILPKQHILPDAPRDGLVINLAEMRVYYFKEQNQPPQTYPISIGREGLQTPTGSTTIVRKKDGPTWTPTPRMREENPDLPVSVPPGPDNPLGTHALYLGWPQYLMHGTNKPYGVGRRVSSGCMRMYPEDIKTLFPQVPVGTKVTVVDQPVKVGWINDSLFVEVSPTQDQSLKIEEDSSKLPPYELTPADINRINKKAGAHASKIDWSLIRKVVAEHSGVPVEVFNISGKTLAEPIRSEKATEEAVAKVEQAPTTPAASAPKIIMGPQMNEKPVEIKQSNNTIQNSQPQATNKIKAIQPRNLNN